MGGDFKDPFYKSHLDLGSAWPSSAPPGSHYMAYEQGGVGDKLGVYMAYLDQDDAVLPMSKMHPYYCNKPRCIPEWGPYILKQSVIVQTRPLTMQTRPFPMQARPLKLQIKHTLA